MMLRSILWVSNVLVDWNLRYFDFCTSFFFKQPTIYKEGKDSSKELENKKKHYKLFKGNETNNSKEKHISKSISNPYERNFSNRIKNSIFSYFTTTKNVIILKPPQVPYHRATYHLNYSPLSRSSMDIIHLLKNLHNRNKRIKLYMQPSEYCIPHYGRHFTPDK